MSLDTRSCYITRRKGKAIEFGYLKPIFKSGRSTICIWEAIALEVNSLVHFLEKKDRMNLDIYIN